MIAREFRWPPTHAGNVCKSKLSSLDRRAQRVRTHNTHTTHTRTHTVAQVKKFDILSWFLKHSESSDPSFNARQARRVRNESGKHDKPPSLTCCQLSAGTGRTKRAQARTKFGRKRISHFQTATLAERPKRRPTMSVFCRPIQTLSSLLSIAEDAKVVRTCKQSTV